MRDILDQVERWRESGERVAVATVIQTWGSARGRAGSAMALTAGGKIAGSVSGGCVEGAVVESGLRCLSTGRPERLRFGVSDETAWSVGLACGGTIDVFVEPLHAETFDAVRAAIREGRPSAVATIIGGAEGIVGRRLLVSDDGTRTGSLGEDLDTAAAPAPPRSPAGGGPTPPR